MGAPFAPLCVQGPLWQHRVSRPHLSRVPPARRFSRTQTSQHEAQSVQDTQTSSHAQSQGVTADGEDSHQRVQLPDKDVEAGVIEMDRILGQHVEQWWASTEKEGETEIVDLGSTVTRRELTGQSPQWIGGKDREPRDRSMEATWSAWETDWKQTALSRASRSVAW